jgi:hypothetical protein
MKPLILSVLTLVCTCALHAAIIEKVVVLTKEDVAQKREVLPWASVWQDKDQVILKLSLYEAYSTPGKFASYSLRVLHEPIDPQELLKKNFDPNRIRRSESSTSKSASFRIDADEVNRAYLVISSWTGEQNGKAEITSECVMISVLAAMTKPLRAEIDPLVKEGNVWRPESLPLIEINQPRF